MHLLILLIYSIIHVVVIPMETEDEVSGNRYLNYFHNFQASILVCLGLESHPVQVHLQHSTIELDEAAIHGASFPLFHIL